MTDDEADAWLIENADLAMRVITPGMVTYQLCRSGATRPDDATVAVAFPETLPHPDGKDLQRFFVRWFVNAYRA